MAAPAATTRQTPGGIYLEEGFSSKITFARDPDVSLWEREVTPPGIDGGDKIDQTTMHNTLWKTSAPGTLLDTTDGQFVAGYDPAVYTQVRELINQPTTITYLFSDGTTIAVYGYLKSFVPSSLVERGKPLATCVIVHTNWDATNRAEAGMTVASVAGT